MATCTCNVGPGKFEGEPALTFMAYEQMLMGGADLSVGCYDFFKAPFVFDADQEVAKAAKDYGYCDACIEDHDNRETYGLVISEDDNGFVWMTTYATEDEYNKAIETAEKEESEEDYG